MPTWILFVLVANPSSGGAVAPELLPPFYQVLSGLLPTGATVTLLREFVYFPGNLHVQPFVILGCWFAASTAAYVLLRLARERKARRQANSEPLERDDALLSTAG